MSDTLKKYCLLAYLNAKLMLVNSELNKFKGITRLFLECEIVNRIHRYGVDYFEKHYLNNFSNSYSDFIKSFIYLKHTEEQLIKFKDDLLSNIKILKKDINSS